MKKVLIAILVVVLLGVVIFVVLNKKIRTAHEEEQSNTAVTLTTLCFAQFGQPNAQGFFDQYDLRMTLSGEKATGVLEFLPAEKDQKSGVFEGTVSAVDPYMMARTAHVWWDTSGEGMTAVEELNIIFGEGTASIGMGEMVNRGDNTGTYVYKDPEHLSYTLQLSLVACSELDERETVTSYLKEHIGTLSPIAPVLGGAWYVTSVVIDPNADAGVVFYEDGHIAEKGSFTYTMNANGTIQTLSFDEK